MREFYEFASGFGISYRSDNPFNILKSKPIIRLGDGRHVVPFRYGEPRAYLPTEHESQFDTVKREVCNSEKSLIFLRNLGLKEPDIVDEVRKQILPKYAQGNEIDGEKHKQDIVVIVKALNEVPRDREYELIQDLKRIPFLLATNAEDVKEFHCPAEIYRRTPELEMYFEGNPEVWFLSSEYASYADDFEEIGVASQVRVSCKSPGYGHVVIEDQYGWHVRGLHGFDPGCSFDGLEFALSQPNIPRSKYIWGRLIPYTHSIEGEVESCTRQTFIESEVERKYSIMGELVREMAWLPNKQGEFVVPKEITLDELPDDFSKDELLAVKLGMYQSYLDNVREEIKQRQEKMDQIEAFEREHPGELDEFMRRRTAAASPDNKPYDSIDHLANMYAAFNHGDKPKPAPLPQSPLNNPDHRPEQTEEELKEFFGPTNERPDLNLAISEVKDPKTRNFLRREYDGHCQISSCNYTFRKRDGTPYFDAVYIASNKGGRRFDNPGNALCLCPNHRAEFLYGTIETPDIFDQIKSYSDDPYHDIEIQLCGEYEGIRYTANHINRLKEIVEAAEKL